MSPPSIPELLIVLGFPFSLPLRLHGVVLRHDGTFHYKVSRRTPWMLRGRFEHHSDQSKFSHSLDRHDHSGRDC